VVIQVWGNLGKNPSHPQNFPALTLMK